LSGCAPPPQPTIRAWWTTSTSGCSNCTRWSAPAGPAARLLALLLAAIAAARGRPSGEVVELVRQGWDQGHLAVSGTEVLMLSQGLAALVQAGELRYAADLDGKLLDSAQATGSLIAFLIAIAHRGWIEARLGRLASAEGEFRAALEPAREHQLTFMLPSLLWFATDVMAERPEAADLATVAENVPLGPMAEVASGALLMDARARVRHATGDTAGATRLAGRARAELAAAGARPRRLHVTGRDALTPSERRVAVLAGAGRTNNEVAQALFITPKTVGTHLTNAYARLRQAWHLLAARSGRRARHE
jgi:DNA-binding CsgD family transcriptional regulator